MVGETTGKYEVVISGVAGQFPEADGFQELADKLNNKVDFISCNNSKWTPGELDVPAGTGKMKNSNGFDLTFFGIHQKLCEIMDPHIRLCLERSYEAICDAGYNPGELSGSNTAVLMASMTSETEYGSVTVAASSGYGMLGHSRTMQANRISYILNLHGPSFVMDSSWTGGMQGLELAHRLISEGQINAALVGVCSLIFRPEVSFHYDRMGKLNHDGKTKSFSDDADGYCRSEACVVLLMQRADDARRSYCTLEGVLAHNYGSRESSLTTSSPNYYAQMLKQLYQKIDLDRLAFVELDGSAAKKVDAMELNGLDEVICSGRKRPLLVGSVKSNLGHTEAASSFVSLAKAVIALDSGIIPPNLHYSQPNSQVEALKAGRIKVVTEPTPLEGDLVGVSCIGIVGTYSHAILRRNPKQKARLTSKGTFPPDRLPRLVVMSGREETKLLETFDKIEAMPVDEEFIALTHHVFKKDIPKHLFRGFTLINEDLSVDRQIQTHVGGKKRPVWFVFSGMGSQWPGMGTHLMKLPVFAEAINKCQRVLQPKGVDVIDIITNPDPSTFDTILHSFVGIAAVQIGLVDVLKTLQIEPDGIVGHSVGELGCAYADGCFTAEQMILSAYARGRASVETKLIKGMMAAVGLGYKEIKDQLPEGIEVACHNSSESCTLSGPEKEMQAYIGELKERGIFAKLVNVANIAYHSKHIAPAAPALLRYLKEVIPSPKARSARWVSSSVGESGWSSELAKYSSAEYHTNNLLSSVLFEEASSHIPSEAIVIEIAPHGLLQAILRRSLATASNVSLTNRTQKDGLRFLLNAIGKLYLEGMELNVSGLYPKVEYPVSRGTPSIHHLLTWVHIDNAHSNMCVSSLQGAPSFKFIGIGLSEEQCEIYCQHKIYDQVVIPSSAYLNIIIDIFNGVRRDKTFTSPTILQNIVFHKNINILPKSNNEFYCQLQQGSGDFEVCTQSDEVVATGRINPVDDVTSQQGSVSSDSLGGVLSTLSQAQLYSYMDHLGVDHGELFRSITLINLHQRGVSGVVMWKGNWVVFLDALFKMVSVYTTSTDSSLSLVSSVRQIIIDPAQFSVDSQETKVVYDAVTDILKCRGLEMVGFRTSRHSIPRLHTTQLRYEKQLFVPYANPNIKDEDCLRVCAQLAMENFTYRKDSCLTKIVIVEIGDEFSVLDQLTHLLMMELNVEVEGVKVGREEELKSEVVKEVNRGYALIVDCGGDAGCGSHVAILLQSALHVFLLSIAAKGSPHALPSEVVQPIFTHTTATHHVSLLRKSGGEKTNWREVEYGVGDWRRELQQKLKEQNERGGGVEGGRIHLVASLSSDLAKASVVHALADHPHAHLLRFVFVDEDVKKEKGWREEVVRRDVKVAMLEGGEWGSLRLLPLECPPTPRDQDTIHNPITLLNQIKSEGVSLKSVGLNLDPTSNLGVLEWSGVEEGRRRFGLGRLESESRLARDGLLAWETPNTWADHEAATIPLAYSIAYYCLCVAREVKRGEGVLIVDACTLVGQASITLASTITSKLFLTVRNQQEKLFITQNYPQVAGENVFLSKVNQFERGVLRGTEGRGVKVILNNSAERGLLEAALLCIRVGGCFYQLNPAPLTSNNFLGMSLFLKETVFHGVTGESLLALPSRKKEEIRQGVEAGLRAGVVTPLSSHLIDQPLTTHHALDTLRSDKGAKRRAVLRVDRNGAEDGPTDYFLCSPHSSYLVLSGCCERLWVEMVEWLVLRGATSISVGLRLHSLPVYLRHRLDELVSKYEGLKVELVPLGEFSSAQAAQQLVSKIHSHLPIAAIFALQLGDAEARLVDGLKLNAPIRKLWVGEANSFSSTPSYQGVKITWLKGLSCLTQLFSCLDSLLLHPDPNASTIVLSENRLLSSYVCDGERSDKLWRLPESLGELEEVSYSLRDEPGWTRVATLSAGQRQEVAPVFLLPGLRPAQLHALAQRLSFPAYVATLPHRVHSIQSAASLLLKELLKLELGIFTMVCSDWSGCLGLALAEGLEREGRTCALVMLDAAPATNIAWARTLSDNDVLNKYFLLSSKVHRELEYTEGWEGKVELVLRENRERGEWDAGQVRHALDAIHYRLKALPTFAPPTAKLNARIFLLRPDGYLENDDCSLQQYCKETVNIEICECGSFADLVRSEKSLEVINNLALFEYEDQAWVDQDNKFRATNILIDAKYNSPQLVRV